MPNKLQSSLRLPCGANGAKIPLYSYCLRGWRVTFAFFHPLASPISSGEATIPIAALVWGPAEFLAEGYEWAKESGVAP